jgi:hypothetical protein
VYAEENKNPFAIGEFATIANDDLDAGNFTGPVLVSAMFSLTITTTRECLTFFSQAITAQTDYIICDGECRGIFEEPARTIFRNTKTFVPYLHPQASHNLNFHFNATGAYSVITDFLDKNLD